MSIHTVAEVRAAICDQLTEALELVFYPVGKTIEVMPCGVVRRTTAEARTDYGKTSPAYGFTVTMMCNDMSEEVAEDWFDQLVSRGNDLSVFDALENDRTLGGTCHTITDVAAGASYEPADAIESTRAVDFTFTALPN